VTILRGIVGFQLFSCLILLAFKRFGSDSVNDKPILDWLFIFSYPMAYLVLALMLILVASDSFHLWSTRNSKYLAWMGFDALTPLLSYLIFEKYYSLIGHI
jgi:hypothetical protein